MNWKAEAIDKLRRYQPSKEALITLSEEIELKEKEYRSIRPARTDSTPVKGGGNGREDAMLSNIMYRQEAERALELARLNVKQVERGLGVLDDTQRRVLEGFYMAKLSRQGLCEELHMEMSTLYRVRDAALRRFTLALYGSMET